MIFIENQMMFFVAILYSFTCTSFISLSHKTMNYLDGSSRILCTNERYLLIHHNSNLIKNRILFEKTLGHVIVLEFVCKSCNQYTGWLKSFESDTYNQ